MKRFSIIGAGNLGTYLINSLVKKGYILKYIYKKAKYPSHQFEAAIEGDIGLIVKQSDFIIISTQESKIREAAELAAVSSDPNGKIFFHTSNSLTSDELISLKEKGGSVASFSPLQTFAETEPSSKENLFKGIFFLAEGDQEAVKLAEKIAGDLEAHVLVVDKEDKPYIHIAAVSASNFLVAILKLAEGQLKKAGARCRVPIDIKVLLPLIKQTLKNVESRGVKASLTGPVKRKEMGIIKKHLELLEGDEKELYKALSKFLKK
ncbi:MAG: DUF2520 domain-containing protein [Candidatus Aminicenantes bacterium]|nr:DUF2520 domain-containing protein [Candidatus Aminicenantes bacterium]NIM81163.1 DUF2520 domain-containing protein [Candidatus Aminicenantes bacterium]NIN20538.1 DUF2520 domain-containing protein [Candidatus Aminicenantes bacterium]NIN44317.1 DUF2520 domain-containing protein [Candidatus Aminicenantes bacterium]NIN87136.1 DUF2520 domain-containing protein [Candidatus Aminicenantes bacterium]